MYNKIRLLKGERLNVPKNKADFLKGDTILGECADPVVLQEWDASEKEAAEETLRKYRCTRDAQKETVDITEYALEYSDDISEFNYELAE